jgi:hypothetical protein
MASMAQYGKLASGPLKLTQMFIWKQGILGLKNSHFLLWNTDSMTKGTTRGAIGK